MKKLVIFVCAWHLLSPANAQSKFQKDFEFYWKTINDNFAYFHTQKTQWQKVKDLYQPQVDSITSVGSFVSLLERINHEFYNGHVFLNSNRPNSHRLIPSGSDLKVSLIGSRYIVTELRAGYNAEACGVRVGMEVTKINDQMLNEAVQIILPKSVTTHDNRMFEYAANVLLAGTHKEPRILTVRSSGKEKILYPDAQPNRTDARPATLLTRSTLAGNIGYIKILNSLGNDDLINAFDSALDHLSGTRSLILDLRETPGGGTTTIARAIMGRFITKEQPYQKHIYSAEEKQTRIRRSTLELVSPRGVIYKQPLVVLAGYWTGSMGEGIAIAFDGMKRAKVAGSRMAGLLGEIFTFRMPETNIGFSFPCVQLQHINGLPRENFVPPIFIKDHPKAIAIAMNLLNR